MKSLQQGSLPLWNPLNGMGAPLLANYQAAFLYPPNWFLLFAGWVSGDGGIAYGFTLLAAVHLAWAGLGMALLLKRLDFSWLAQIIGGVAFGLSGYLVARLGFFSMVWVGAWLPWVIYFVHGLKISAGRIEFSPGLTACLALQLLAGHAQLAWYSILIGGGWVTVAALGQKSFKRVLTAWGSFGLAVLLAAGIASVQLVPTFEYLRNSQRADAFAYQEAMTYSFWPWRFLTIFSPDFFGSPGKGDYWGYASYWEDHFYMGMLPVLLAFVSLAAISKSRKSGNQSARRYLVTGCWGLVLASFTLGLGKNTPLFPFLYWNIPTFDMFQAPTRYLIGATFALPILAAAGIERWRCPTGKGLYWFRLATAGAFAITLGAGAAWLFMDNIRLTFIRSTALTGLWGLCFGLLTLAIPLAEKKGHIMTWRVGVILVALVDLLVAGWSLNPGTTLNFYSKTESGRESLKMQAGSGRVYLNPQAEYDLKFHRFLRFNDFQPIEDWSGMRSVILPNLNLLDGVALVANFDPLVSERYQRWMGAINRLSPQERRGWLAFSNVVFEEQIDVREASGVRFDFIPDAQRWHWYSCAMPVKNSEEAWSALEKEWGIAPQPGRRVILEESSIGGNGECRSGEPARVTMISERPDQVTLRVEAAEPGWLELMD
ncbi:MAG: YfhO family protein, partial [Anaerolineaceae bacterium]|nr:YfhO family protein [Anaerolineaceae bacterium]